MPNDALDDVLLRTAPNHRTQSDGQCSDHLNRILLIVNCSETQLIYSRSFIFLLFLFLLFLSPPGDRPHECEICQKRFALQCNLRAHMKTHEEPQSEKCLRCGREYPISTGLVTMGCCHECYLGSQSIPLLRQKWSSTHAHTHISPNPRTETSQIHRQLPDPSEWTPPKNCQKDAPVSDVSLFIYPPTQRHWHTLIHTSSAALQGRFASEPLLLM